MHSTKVVAELGINWQADFDLLLKMADAAFSAGADLIKLQLRTPDVSVPKEEWDKPRQWFDGSWTTYIDYKRRMELTKSQLREFSAIMTTQYGSGCWFASVFDIPSLERVAHFDIPYIKIPSAMLTNHELINAALDTDIPLILSTGMSTMREIEETLKLIPIDHELVIMQCTATYPAADHELDLRVIWNYIEKYSTLNTTIGFSSHSPSPYPAVYAALLGAEMVEHHFSLNRAFFGSDHSASLEPAGLALLCREIKRLPVLMGDGVKKVHPSELDKRRSLRGV
jgi:N-acetylneuraminate synthase